MWVVLRTLLQTYHHSPLKIVTFSSTRTKVENNKRVHKNPRTRPERISEKHNDVHQVLGASICWMKIPTNISWTVYLNFSRTSQKLFVSKLYAWKTGKTHHMEKCWHFYTTLTVVDSDFGILVYLKYGFKMEGCSSTTALEIQLIWEGRSSPIPFHLQLWFSLNQSIFNFTPRLDISPHISLFQSNKLHCVCF